MCAASRWKPKNVVENSHCKLGEDVLDMIAANNLKDGELSCAATNVVTLMHEGRRRGIRNFRMQAERTDSLSGANG